LVAAGVGGHDDEPVVVGQEVEQRLPLPPGSPTDGVDREGSIPRCTSARDPVGEPVQMPQRLHAETPDGACHDASIHARELLLARHASRRRPFGRPRNARGC